jgi:GntR family transcriptional regulator
MHLQLNPHSGEPIYRQIVEAIKFQIASGRLAEGEQLPSVRALASDLKINMRTAVKAYEDLSHAGLVVLQQGKGAFVTAPQRSRAVGTRRKEIAELAKRLLAEAASMGASPDEVVEIVRSVANNMEPGR